MDWLSKLRPIDQWAGISFLASKAVGFIALCSLGLANKLPALAVISGSLWGILLITTMVLCILSWRSRKEDRDQKEFERLLKKYSNKELPSSTG